MKWGHRTQNEEKKGDDAVTPLGSPDSPQSPDEGVNVDHSDYHGSQDEMVGDVDVLPSTSTHVFNMSLTPKKHQPPRNH